MQKPIISNRFLNKKWNDKENDIYLRKIWLAKPSNSIQCSVKSKSLVPKLKPKQKEHFFTTRQFEIERDNKTLLDKISNISSKSNLSKNEIIRRKIRSQDDKHLQTERGESKNANFENYSRKSSIFI
jgi:hypothetical protein